MNPQPQDPWAASLSAAWPNVETGTTRDGTLWARTVPDALVAFAAWAREQGYRRFLDCSVVDTPAHPERFEVHHLLYSMARKAWLRIKCRTAGSVPSLTGVFAAADWYEREAFDLFGVDFTGHPDLRRILLPDDFVGHPLRADHPLGGEPVDFTVTREIYGT
jgi:NADH-quinone oxidoreductase subunit C